MFSGGMWVPRALAADPSAVIGAGGMGSPEAAVEELLASVRASDPVGLLAVLHPDERRLVDTLYTNTASSAENAGAVDVDALLRSLYVEVSPGELVVEQLNERLAWVTTNRAEVTARLDVGQLDDAVAADLSDVAPLDEYRGLFAPQGANLGIAVVNEGGQWFVSALYTAAEIARRELELRPQFSTAPIAPAKTTTPEEAVTALATAVSSQDPRAVASLLTPFEGRLVADYEATLGAELIEVLEGYDLSVDLSHIQTVGQDDDWAIVEVDRWSVAAFGQDDFGDDVDWQLTVDGFCGEFRQWYGDEYFSGSDAEGVCLFTADSLFNAASFLRDEGWRGPRFAVVNNDGSWSVSLLQTALNVAAPFTTDAVTAVSVAEVFLGFTDGFHVTAAELVAVGAPVLTVGTSPVATSGHGRVAVFRVEPGVGVSVDIQPGDHRSCLLFIVDPDDLDVVACDERIAPLPHEAIVIVSTSGATVFSGLEPLGVVTVTVSAA